MEQDNSRPRTIHPERIEEEEYAAMGLNFSGNLFESAAKEWTREDMPETD